MSAELPGMEGGDLHGSDDQLLAGEYVLGVLDTGTAAAVRARIAAEPPFAQLVLDWEARLGPWLLGADAVAPPPQLWPRLRTRLGWPAATAAPVRPWNDVRVWRASAALAAAAAIAAIAIGLRPTLPPGGTPGEPSPAVVDTGAAPPSVQPDAVPDAAPDAAPDAIVGATPVSGEAALTRPVTVLLQPDGKVGWMAAVDAAAGKLHMMPVPREADAQGRVHELWLIPSGGAPRSLGFVSNERAHTVLLPAALQAELAAGATLAITLERPEGMPHAAPAGPIVASGEIGQT